LSSDSIDYAFLIRKRLDALNIVVHWILSECSYSDDDELDISVIPNRYLTFGKLLEFQAKPYSGICAAYIGYSRGKFTANIDEHSKIITFIDNPEKRSITISNVAESIQRDKDSGVQFAPSLDFSDYHEKLIQSIKFIEGHIAYSLDDDVWQAYKHIMEKQWNSTSELPETWAFDNFSINDFKRFWIATATYALIHMLACLKSGTTGVAVEDAILVKSPAYFSSFISAKSGVEQDVCDLILHFLTFDNKIKNNDVIYQPFIQIDNDLLAFAPHLILASRPERNLITLINKKKDKFYFTLTNLREGFMQEELTAKIKDISGINIATNRALPDVLPDVDYAIFDSVSNSVLVCELKWLVEPDSPQEVYSRTDDLEHGCRQITDILAYAKQNQSDFCERVFGKDCGDKISFLGCVVSKKGIRAYNLEVPVISLSALIELLQKRSSVYDAFLDVQSRAYLLSTPSYFEFGLQAVKYAGYTFEIPALI